MKTIIYNDFKKKINKSQDLFIYDLSYQFIHIDKIYNNNKPSIEIIREIKKKHSSYKQQDKLKKKYDIKHFITYDELLKKLYDSKLECYYCENDLFLTYDSKKEPRQWSLERLNNNIGHYNNNTCISCLKCNLQRRTDNYEYFKFSKKLIIKKDE
tara:strand:- start:268 stop:732 length:465 start_codon:yes stop_codon:yes gene_type:complete